MSSKGNDQGKDQGKDRVPIRQLPTGVPGLDEILGGGLPEYSFNIIAGAPGCGKTTLAHQIMFATATPERPALYFTVLGEPAIKMLRYQQQFAFFDHATMDASIRFINLSHVVLEQDLGAVLDAIMKEIEASKASIVVVDSFRTVVRKALNSTSEMELQGFVQRLALHLTSWQATTFLIGEYVEGELRDNPVFTVADGLFWLYQNVERNSIVRKMQVMKLRGQESVPGMHTFRITDAGLQTFPRTFGLVGESGQVKGQRRLSTGVSELDALMGGGIPEGDSLLLAGPSGSGKSTLGTQFIAEGLRQGEPGSWPSLRKYRPSMRSGPPCLASTSTRPKRTGCSRSSISARWISPLMRRFTKSSTALRKLAASDWLLTHWSASRWRWPPASAPTSASHSTG
jgi:circadian clock protein KaiC